MRRPYCLDGLWATHFLKIAMSKLDIRKTYEDNNNVNKRELFANWL